MIRHLPRASEKLPPSRMKRAAWKNKPLSECRWMSSCHKPRNGYTYCAKHMKKSRINRRKVRSLRLRLGLCVYCQEPAMPGRVSCEKHARQSKHNNAVWRKKKQKERGWKLVRVKV